MPKTKEQCESIREETRQQIIQAAIKLFAYQGFAATKIKDIASEAVVSVGLVYHYFSSKEELFSDIVEDTVQKSNEGLMAFGQMPLPAADKLVMLSQMVVEGILKDEEHTMRFMMMIQAGLYSGDALINTSMYTKKNIPIQVTAKLIEEAQRDGRGRDGDATMLATLFWAAVNGLCMQKLVTKDAFVIPEIEVMRGIVLK